jgi:hypothetical protein
MRRSRSPAWEEGERLLREILEARTLDEARAAARALAALSRPFHDWAGKAEGLDLDPPGPAPLRPRAPCRRRAAVGPVEYSLAWRTQPYPKDPSGRLRTSFRSGPAERRRDWIFFEAEGQSQYVGVVHRLLGVHSCEGDNRFHPDGSRSPAFYGTGSEDYYHQACWPNRDNHTPFHGCVEDLAEEAAKVAGKTTTSRRATRCQCTPTPQYEVPAQGARGPDRAQRMLG